MGIEDILKPKSREEIMRDLNSMSLTERLELKKKFEDAITRYKPFLGKNLPIAQWENRNVKEVVKDLKKWVKCIKDTL
jgi:hypothetical protein